MKLNQKNSKEYFNQARSWADDLFSQLQQSRNRYQLAFTLSMGLNIFSCISVAILANYQTLVPLLVHHYENGVTTVEQLGNQNTPKNEDEVKFDIVRYITNREAYDVSSYRAQFDLINLLSSHSVGSEYLQEQDKNNKESPINNLGTHASRVVHVYSVTFLDSSLLNENDLPKNHHNLAEVVFTLTDTDKTNGKNSQHHYSALIAWNYTTPPASPAVRWQNWDGFQVTRYSKTLRNIKSDAANPI